MKFDIEKFRNLKIMVIGDIMLDEYIFGESDRLSPEAPVPIVNVNRHEYRLGGAANVANNLSKLGITTNIFGMVGTDSDADILCKLLISDDKIISNVWFDNEYRTIKKVRIISSDHHITRLDYEEKDNKKIDNTNLKNWIDNEIRVELNYIMKEYDIIIFSDYNKGFLNEYIINFFTSMANYYDKKIIVDSKKKNYWPYNNCFLITPNKKEAETSSNIKITTMYDAVVAGTVLNDIHNTNILITMGKEGMILVERDGNITEIPSISYGVYDVSGAGDTVVAVISIMTAMGYTLKQSCLIANACASHVIKRIGTSPITYEEFSKELLNYDF